jgi:hypothetical protein
MSTAPPLGLELRGAVAAEYLDLATILEAGPRSIYGTPHHCVPDGERARWSRI